LLVETTLLLKFGNSGIYLLLLLFCGKGAFFGSGCAVVTVLAPVSEMAGASHVVLGKPKNL
jgi:hypothetical protein